MTFWREEKLNEAYRRECMEQAEKARLVRAVQEQKTEDRSLFTRKSSR